jgi:hypothetical protein
MIVLFAKIMEINGTVASDARLLSGSINRQADLFAVAGRSTDLFEECFQRR